ncbi:di-trans,poly-cis-decaprenylcistransferase [Patescibacteria group bacterium]|nr:di-trans,poly-cis-decaprenylcistransferase [Patescibacteria group bacterium]
MKKTDLSLPEGTKVPKHIAIIPDGNRRWARERGLPALEGHRRGAKVVTEIVRASRDLGIHTVTLWGFSTENWNRSDSEISFLMQIFEDLIDENLKEAKKEGVRIYHLGRKDRITPKLRRKIERAVEETQDNTRHVFNFGLDYGGHDELLRAIGKALGDVQRGEITVNDLCEVVGKYSGKYPYYLFKNYLDTKGQPYPYPDLVIRTSGEQRTSGFLTWQVAYAEYRWETDHFPDFSPEKLKQAILDFSRRRRRFGGTDEMVPKVNFDPKKAAQYEVGWWKAHHYRDTVKMRENFVKLVSEVYSMDLESASGTLDCFTRAVVEGHNQRDWVVASEEMSKFYQLIKESTQMNFDPRAVGILEVAWWEIHDELEEVVDKQRLEDAFVGLYGEIYQQSAMQLQKAAHLRAMATFEHDLAEKEGISSAEAGKHWKEAQVYLEKFYHELRELVS